jgi:hypothetical protein
MQALASHITQLFAGVFSCLAFPPSLLFDVVVRMSLSREVSTPP